MQGQQKRQARDTHAASPPQFTAKPAVRAEKLPPAACAFDDAPPLAPPPPNGTRYAYTWVIICADPNIYLPLSTQAQLAEVGHAPLAARRVQRPQDPAAPLRPMRAATALESARRDLAIRGCSDGLYAVAAAAEKW